MNKIRRPIIAGNWKMHGTKKSVAHLLDVFKSKLNKDNLAEIIIFPPFIFIEQVANLLKSTPIQYGGQNMATALQGAYTGEISGQMLLEFGCRYVLLGHSERRSLFSETNEIVAEKFKLAHEIGLCPILCVGETLVERKEGRTEEIVTQQLESVIEFMGGVSALSNAILAYEPVWAIGTGVTATPEQAQEVHFFLRERIALYDTMAARNIRILYGGSVKASNAQLLFEMPDIDGGLIGGASLDAEEFFQINQAAGIQ